MTAITQHAIVEKERVEVSFSLIRVMNLRHIVMPHTCYEMQSKLSKTRVSPLGSMG